MPSKTGIWNQQEANEHHIFSYRVAKWIGEFISYTNNIVYDLGCGKGTYTKYFQDIGRNNSIGIDGEEYEDVECDNFSVNDLTNKLKFTEKGVIICLEVGEHIPEEYLETFIDNLTNNSSGLIILSWAVPGQDGIGHVSCRTNQWVIDEMAKRGFKFNELATKEIRKQPEGYVNYFKDTLMIFNK